MERLSRYCHRGLSSGGSRRFSRRDRQGGNHLPAGEGWCRVRAWVSRVPGVSLSRSQASLLRPPASPRGLCLGYGRLGATYPGRGRWRRQRPMRPSPGPARRAQRFGALAGSWCGPEAAGVQVTCAGATGTAARPAGPRGSALPGQCPRSRGLDHHLAATCPYCKPPPRGVLVSSGGRFSNCAGQGGSTTLGVWVFPSRRQRSRGLSPRGKFEAAQIVKSLPAKQETWV